MTGPRLGLTTAIVIIFVNGFAVGAVRMLLAQSQIVSGAVLGDGSSWTRSLLFEAPWVLLAAIGICVGVGISGYRIAYGAAVFALGVGTVSTTMLDFALTPKPAEGSSIVGFAPAGYGILMFPLGLAFGLLLPAYILTEHALPADASRPAP